MTSPGSPPARSQPCRKSAGLPQVAMTTWRPNSGFCNHRPKLPRRDQQLTASPVFAPAANLEPARENQIRTPNQSHRMPHCGYPTSSHPPWAPPIHGLQSEHPKTLPLLFHWKAFLLPCLPLSLSQAQVMVADSLALAS